MPIKNYTTAINSEKTVNEIESILTRHGASKIMKEFDGEGGVSAVCFILPKGEIEIPFRLPLREDSIMLVLSKQNREGKLPKSFLNKAQARRIGWRILKDWVDSQMALVEIGMAKAEEVFMPYLYNYQTNKTLFETAELHGGISKLLQIGWKP